MRRNLPTKQSSRSGRFKKKLVGLDFLINEAPLIENLMSPLKDLLEERRITEAEFTGLYILTVLSHRFPGTWLGPKRKTPLFKGHCLNFDMSEFKKRLEPNVQKRLCDTHNLGDIFNNYSFRSTPLAVNRAILSWSMGEYGLELMFRIPTPQEVLGQQKFGKRCVTVLLEKERTSKFILGQRDALSFTMHDLIHADHFYHNNQCFLGQVGFYGLLDFCMTRGDFKELFKIPAYESEFDYLISDMNAYAIHLLKCFKSALIFYHGDKEKFFEGWLNSLTMTHEERVAFLTLNTEDYQTKNDIVLLQFLKRFQPCNYLKEKDA
jgi:hypothetical protein